MSDTITIKGIQTNNLKNIDVSLKKNALNLIVGPSGSGKSSLAYETIAQLGLHEFRSMFEDDIEEPSYIIRDYKNMRAAIPIRQNNYNHNTRSTIATYFGINTKVISLYAIEFGVPTDTFSLNREENTCQTCFGTGYVHALDIDKLVDYRKSIGENPFRCWQRYSDLYVKLIAKVCEEQGIDTQKTFTELTVRQQRFLLYGESNNKYKITYKHGKGSSTRTTKYYGVMTGREIRKNFKMPERFYSDLECSSCSGKRYADKCLRYKWQSLSIGDFMTSPFSKLARILKDSILNLNNNIEKVLAKDIFRFVAKAVDLNLGHLSFYRSIPTLSGGELQRLRLIQVFNTQLTDLILVLDEPLAGLSGNEKRSVYDCVIKLAKNHTLVIVDHSDAFLKVSDNVIALGEGGGENGGRIIDAARYLSNQKVKHTITHKPISKLIEIKMGNRVYDYKGVCVSIAENCLNGISGKSGVGKSTLLREYLPFYFDQYEYINQKPLVGNINSNVATVLGISDQIFELFAERYDADKDAFSNQTGKAGCCPACGGAGVVEYRWNRLVCKECNGTGFKQQLKEYTINGKSLFDIWAMTINEALRYFGTISKKIAEKLHGADDLALGHLKLGQATSTLSGGENIRIKLLKVFNSSAKVLGVDEPFKGLDFQEIYLVTQYLIKQRDKGKTILIVDHNTEAFKFLDRHIELEVQKNIIMSKEYKE